MTEPSPVTQKGSSERPPTGARRRLWRRIGLAVGVLLIAIVIGFGWLLETRSGLEFAWARLLPMLPFDATAAKIEGRLAGSVTLDNVVINTDGEHIEIAQVELDWDPWALLKGVFAVDQFLLSDVAVTPRPTASIPPPPEAETPFALPNRDSLPVAVRIDQIVLTNLTYSDGTAAPPINIRRIAFGVSLDDQQWALLGIDVDSQLVSATGQLSVAPYGRYRTDGEIKWTFRPEGYPAASGITRLSGDTARLVLQQSIAPPYQLTARVTLLQLLDYAGIKGKLNTRIEPAALGLDVPAERIEATVNVGGTLDKTNVRATANIKSAELANVAIDLYAHYNGQRVDVETLKLYEPGSDAQIALDGTVTLESDPTVALNGHWKALAWPPQGEPMFNSPSGEVHIAGTLADLQAKLAAKVGRNGVVMATAHRQDQKFDANLSWMNVAWPAEDPTAHSRKGTLMVSGTLDDYSLALDSALVLGTGPAGQLHVQGSGNTKSLNLNQIDLDILDGRLTGAMAARWSPELAVQMSLSAGQLNPGVLDPTWPGRISGRLTAKASSSGKAWSATLDSLNLHGTLRHRPLDVQIKGHYVAGIAHIRKLSMQIGQSTLHASGSLGSHVDLQLHLNSPDLVDVCPECSGHLEADLELSGPRDTPQVVVTATGAGIQVPGAAIKKLDLSADVDVAGIKPSRLDVQIKGLEVADTTVSELSVNGAGNAASHTLSLDAATSLGTAEIKLKGQLAQPWTPGVAWHFRIDEANFAYPELSPWHVRPGASGLVTRNTVELNHDCWESGQASLCVDATIQADDHSSAKLVLTALPFAYFKPLLPDGVGASGALSANIQASLESGHAPHIVAELKTTAGHIGPTAAGASTTPAVSEGPKPSEGRARGLVFGAGRAHLVSNDAKTVIDVDWPLEETGVFVLHGTLDRKAGEPLRAAVLTGNARVAIHDLSFMGDFSDQVVDLSGQLDGKVALSGTVAAPSIVGKVAFQNVSAQLVAPGITIENFNLDLVGDGSGHINIDGHAESGTGYIDAKGRVNLAGALPTGHLQLNGRNFEIFNTKLGRAWVTPKLDLNATADRIALTGSVTIPKASLTPDSLPAGAIQVSSDQVIVGKQGQATTDPLLRPFYANIHLILGDEVTIDGLGLKATLGGEVQIVQAPGQPATGSGELGIVHGTYKAYGQDLVIRKGRLIFAGGPLSTPGLDVEAVRQATVDILVGVHVGGTLLQPTISLFSEPPLPEQEQLSYLVLGRPLNNASSSESSALANAALALGLKGGNFVSKRLNKSLGFQEFGIETEPGAKAKTAAFVIGRYLTPKLYVSYGIGLFQPINTLKLRYTISSRWRLETETSSKAKGADLIYHIERGG